MTDADKDNLISRAISAYYRWGFDPNNNPIDTTSLITIKNKDYVICKKDSELMAVYRVRNDGKLKRLKRLPEGIN